MLPHFGRSGVEPLGMEHPPASSLSDLGNRSEASGKSRTDFRPFEANSGNYLTKMIGTMDRFPTAAVGSF